MNICNGNEFLQLNQLAYESLIKTVKKARQRMHRN